MMKIMSSFLKILMFFCCIIQLVASIDHLVGADNGWSLPKKDVQFYNIWASQNRFILNDTLYFKYKKDSVMVVSEQEYKKCKPVHPLFFSNNGDTAYVVDKPGLFYFISGISGHCERGQKMIIKVLEPDHHRRHDPDPDPDPDPDHNNKNASFSTLPVSLTLIVLLSFSFLGLLLL